MPRQSSRFLGCAVAAPPAAQARQPQTPPLRCGAGLSAGLRWGGRALSADFVGKLLEFAEIASAADAVAHRVAVVDAGKLPAHALDLDVLLGA